MIFVIYTQLQFIDQSSQKMHLNVKIQDHAFKLSIGSGHNDWTWLSHYAARRFSKISYPQGTYLPTQLTIICKDNSKLIPHPRQKINTFLTENNLTANNITVLVRIRKGNSAPTEAEKNWQHEAYGLERMMMNVVYVLDDLRKNKEGDQDSHYKVMLQYTMHHDVKHMFSEKKYASHIQLPLEEAKIDNNYPTLKGHLKLPFGEVSVIKNPIFYFRDPKDPTNFRSVQLKHDMYKSNLLVSPKYVSIEETNEMVSQEMKVSENIAKSLQEKQLQAKKRNVNPSICCYSFEQFWKLLQQHHGDQLLLESYDKSTRERLKVILQKSLNSLYEIFYYYYIIQNQTKQKKQELGVTYQHVMHFLRFYQIYKTLDGLIGFLQYYNRDFKFRHIKDTVDIQNKAVKFVQFIAILLRAIQFQQTEASTTRGETFDVSVAKIIDRVIQIDGEQEDLSEYKKHIRENHKIISFFRNNSDALKQIFVNQAVRSAQKASDKYVLMKEQFKSLLQLSSLTNKNTDTIVLDLFQELKLPEDGIFYYEFIQAIQWLALTFVSSDKDGANIESVEEQSFLIVEKLKFFIEKVQL